MLTRTASHASSHSEPRKAGTHHRRMARFGALHRDCWFLGVGNWKVAAEVPGRRGKRTAAIVVGGRPETLPRTGREVVADDRRYVTWPGPHRSLILVSSQVHVSVDRSTSCRCLRLHPNELMWSIGDVVDLSINFQSINQLEHQRVIFSLKFRTCLSGYYNAIRLRFDYDSTTTIDIKITIRLRFDFDLTRRSGHHDSTLMKAWIHTRRHFTSEVCEKARPTSTIERCYPMLIRHRECHSYYYRDVHYCVIICPDRCLLIGYDSSRRDEKMNMFIFRRSRIEAESKSNRDCNSHFKGCGHAKCSLSYGS